MTIIYNGSRINHNPHTKKTMRTAVIYYNENDNADCQATEYIIKVLEINGWPTLPCGVSGSFEIEVEDREEYDALVAKYKGIKKSAKLEAKFFPRRSKLYFPDHFE